MSAFDEPAVRLDLSTVEAGALAVELWIAECVHEIEEGAR